MNKEYKLNALEAIANFLSDYRDYLASNSCNDYKMKNTDENWQLYKEAVYGNGDKEEIKRFEETPRPDGNYFLVMDIEIVFACQLVIEKLMKEIEENE